MNMAGDMPLGWNFAQINELDDSSTDLEKKKAKILEDIRSLDLQRMAKVKAIKDNEAIVKFLAICSNSKVDTQQDCLAKLAEQNSSLTPEDLPALSPEETTFVIQELESAERFNELKSKRVREGKRLRLQLLRFDSTRRMDVANYKKKSPISIKRFKVFPKRRVCCISIMKEWLNICKTREAGKRCYSDG